MRSIYSTRLEQQKKILMQAYLESEQAGQQAEQKLEELQEQEDKLLLTALKACLASRKTYEDLMTYLNGEQYYGRAGEYETVDVRNGMQYIKRKFRESYKALDEKKAQLDAQSAANSAEEWEEYHKEVKALFKDESNVRTRTLTAIKASSRTYEEILAYARAPRE